MVLNGERVTLLDRNGILCINKPFGISKKICTQFSERERALCVYKSVICAEWSSIDHHHKRLHVLRERDVVTKGRLAREREE